MSRSITQIQNSLIANIQTDPTLGPLLTSPSATAIWKLWSYIVATSQGTEEQLYDLFVSQIESLLAVAAPMTAPWIRNQVLNFQYSSSDPQVIQLNTTTFAPYWPIINPAYRIVTRCSVTRGLLNAVTVKVAKGTTPAPLATAELSALQSFLDTICAPGIVYTAVSVNPDKISTAVTVYYQGVYSSVIGNNLLAAYNNYIGSIPFDGAIKISDLEIALRNVTGVNDVVINDAVARADSTSFGSATVLVVGNDLQQRQWQTIAGYAIDETTTGYDFLSRLTLVSQ